jgi:hypothetical protein
MTHLTSVGWTSLAGGLSGVVATIFGANRTALSATAKAPARACPQTSKSPHGRTKFLSLSGQHIHAPAAAFATANKNAAGLSVPISRLNDCRLTEFASLYFFKTEL